MLSDGLEVFIGIAISENLDAVVTQAPSVGDRENVTILIGAGVGFNCALQLRAAIPGLQWCEAIETALYGVVVAIDDQSAQKVGKFVVIDVCVLFRIIFVSEQHVREGPA
ncbi:hypothetical protein D9M70_447980 [compost metagenome]